MTLMVRLLNKVECHFLKWNGPFLLLVFVLIGSACTTPSDENPNLAATVNSAVSSTVISELEKLNPQVDADSGSVPSESIDLQATVRMAVEATLTARDSGNPQSVELSTSPTPTPDSDSTPIDFRDLKNAAMDVVYDDLFRNNELHIGKLVHYRGKIVQVHTEQNDDYQLRVNVTEDSGSWQDTLLVQHSGQRLLEGDVIEFVGEVLGLVTYDAIFGNQVTIPHLNSIQLHLEREPVVSDGIEPTVEGAPTNGNPGEPLTPTSTPAPGHSISAPIPMGSAVEVTDDGVTVAITVIDVVRGFEAWDEIQSANQFNDPAPENQEYLLASIQIQVLSTLHADDSLEIHPRQLTAVSGLGRVYENISVVDPKPEYDGELFVGGAKTGWNVFVVDESDSDPLMRYEFARERISFDPAKPLWFKLSD